MKLLYFSVVRERLKKGEEELNFSGSVRELKAFLKGRYPELSDLLDSLRFAVNEEYVDEDYHIKDEDTVAIIPPVSGG